MCSRIYARIGNVYELSIMCYIMFAACVYFPAGTPRAYTLRLRSNCCARADECRAKTSPRGRVLLAVSRNCGCCEGCEREKREKTQRKKERQERDSRNCNYVRRKTRRVYRFDRSTGLLVANLASVVAALCAVRTTRIFQIRRCDKSR